MNELEKQQKYMDLRYPVSTAHLYLLLSSWRNNHNGAARHPNSANMLLLLIGQALNYYMVRVTTAAMVRVASQMSKEERSEGVRWGNRTR